MEVDPERVAGVSRRRTRPAAGTAPLGPCTRAVVHRRRAPPAPASPLEPPMQDFFPRGAAHYLAGGALLGLAVALAYALCGLVTGMSSFFSSTWSWFSRAAYFQQARFTSSRNWRLALAVGLVLGGALFVAGGGTAPPTAVPAWRLLLGGFLAGYGARLSNGCTSGHGLCGLGALQLPSLVAVLTFLATAMLTAHAVAWMGAAA